jgi:DNA mismatch endonuclease (patch repair protein)
MAAIRRRDTRIEWQVRRALHVRGFRYRVDLKTLPGRPDIAFTRRHCAVFLHGCWWHGHDCPLFRWPTTRREFWETKISGNIVRDRRNVDALLALGWRVATVWECALRGQGADAPSRVAEQITAWLGAEAPQLEIRGPKAK